MDKMFYSAVILLSAIQIQYVLATGCDIVSVTSPSASTLSVTWSSYAGAESYELDLKVVNSTTIPSVVVTVSPLNTERTVQGLRPGHHYTVTLKVFVGLSVVCTDTVQSLTVPATSQITSAIAVSSTSIRFEWSAVTGADSYILFIEELLSSPLRISNHTFTTLSGQVDGLTPSTTYSCYLKSSNSAGNGQQSQTKVIMTLVQPPTGVNITKTGRSTAHVSWNPVSKVLLYQVTVIDTDSNNPPVIIDTSETSINISNLEPCSTYVVGVSSLNVFLNPGEASNVSHITSTINPVSTISVDYDCSTSTVEVTWDLVFGANSYRAMAVDSTGAYLNCTSDSERCQISMLKCGETYQVHVIAISDDCESAANTSPVFQTVPCAPANLRTSHACSSNVIIFLWDPTIDTSFYVAKAVDNAGDVTECRTVDTMCFFTTVGCGQSYVYTVFAVTSQCDTEVGQTEPIQTAPCLPTNIRTGGECNADTLTTSWDSSAGALFYFVEAEGNNGDFYTCSSPNNSCDMSGVPCGEHLSVWVTASNNDCNTSRVLGNVAQTIPCTPTNLSVTIDCRQHSAVVNWTASIGIVSYVVSAWDAYGNTHSCSSMSTNCLIEGLMCGRYYNATIIGTNLKCNSTVSRNVAFMTAPCPPANVMANRNCDENNALISWQDHQPTGVYTATVEDQMGAQVQCNSTTVNNCVVSSLPCGMTYSVTVSYNDGECLSISSPISMDSVPCGPENVSTSVTCVTGELTVTWDIPVPTENYVTFISKGMDQLLFCNSTETNCTTGGLMCGSSYMVTISSLNGTCFSLRSAEVTVQALPCPPTGVAAMHACAPDPVPVTWMPSDSAKYYTAVAVSDGGHRSECMTNETYCSLPGLQCGETYTIGVSGADENCIGGQSNTTLLNTEPCPPYNVSSQLMCSVTSAQVFWAPSVNAMSYAVTANTDGQTLTCTSTSTNCTLTDLVCDQPYYILVNATDGTCVSNYSASYRQDEVPCVPVNISTNLSCGTNRLTVNWTGSSSALPLNYTVTAMPLGGNEGSASCYTSQTSCYLHLQCGTTYNVSVKASTGGCRTAYSQPETVQTGPCSPVGLRAVTACGMNSLWVFWNASLGATSYLVMVTDHYGFKKSCSSYNYSCSVSGLQCARQYNVTATALDSRCASLPSQTVAMTGPCDPVNVTSVLHCGSDMATVSWAPAAGALAYTVVAQQYDSPYYTSCRSNTTYCYLDQLQCGKYYNLTVLAEDAMCNSTGNTSVTLVTAPCSPTIQSSSLVCGTNSSSLSWMMMAKATGYVVNAMSTKGHTVSCSSYIAMCLLNDLLCSETYTARVTAQGSQCDSAPGPGVNITTSPCPPTIIYKQYSCSNSTAKFRWTNPEGSLSFLATVAGDGFQESDQTTNTSTMFQALPCGLYLNLTVQAQGPECNSTAAVGEYLHTVPCAPQGVTAMLVCHYHTVLVSWLKSSGATWYNVTLVAHDGHTHHCQTNTTSCQVPDIHCGYTYNITVTPYSEMCAGQESSVYVFKAGLCAPSNVTVSPACQDSIVSWSNVTGADMFVAIATAKDGHTHNCSAHYSNSCNFTDLHCSESYDVTVVTVDRGCWSKPSSAVELRTALCAATNFTGQISCENNTLTLTWDQNAESLSTYLIRAERIGSMLPPSMHTTSNTSYVVTDLLCGQRYAFSIAAEYGGCLSSYSLPIEIRTAPCQPTNFSTHVDCATNKGNFSWAEMSGADFYIVTVTGDHGHMASCSSNDTYCCVTLHCSRSYYAKLVAATESCNSTQYATIHFDSAPCPASNVFAEINCTAATALVSWTEAAANTGYSVQATTADGANASCSAMGMAFCTLNNLDCGQIYSVVVEAIHPGCPGPAGAPFMLTTQPCPPSNVMVYTSCEDHIVRVSWTPSPVAETYHVVAVSKGGYVHTCNTTDSNCSYSELYCEKEYTVYVKASHENCSSKASENVTIITGPCQPDGLSVTYSCGNQSAQLTWTPTYAAIEYYGRAQDGYGDMLYCHSMYSMCTIEGLDCGKTYNFSVKASDGVCNGSFSEPVQVGTAPCPPDITWVQPFPVQMEVQVLRFEWTESVCNNTEYRLRLTGSLLGDPWALFDISSYYTEQTYFEMTLPCGSAYNATVDSRNAVGTSAPSVPLTGTTAPCPPTGAVYSESTATATWQSSVFATTYTVHDGSTELCNTPLLSCDLSGITFTTLEIRAVNAAGESEATIATRIP